MSKSSRFFSRLGALISIGPDLPSEPLFTDEDINAVQSGESGTSKLLGVYTRDAIWQHFSDFSIISTLNTLGFTHLHLTLDTSDPFVHNLKFTDDSLHDKPPEGRFLISLFVRRKVYSLGDWRASKHELGAGEEGAYELMQALLPSELHMTVVEWLCLQNPLRAYPPHRPQLPGQKYPGLGVAKKVDDMLSYLSEKKGRDGLLNFPEYFHNAVLYNETNYFFINPAFQAFFLSLLRDLAPDIQKYGLAAVSWAFGYHLVRDRSTHVASTPAPSSSHTLTQNTPATQGHTQEHTQQGTQHGSVAWKPQEQVRPSSRRMWDYFRSTEYQAYVQAHTHTGRYYIDWGEAREHIAFAMLPSAEPGSTHTHTDTHTHTQASSS